MRSVGSLRVWRTATPTITKAFVVCSARTTDDTAQLVLYTCDLNTGPGPRLTPDRSLYQRFPGAFTANGRPLSVTNRLLVNGTAIVDAGLYGEWCVDLFLDQEEAPIFRRGFVLTAP